MNSLLTDFEWDRLATQVRHLRDEFQNNKRHTKIFRLLVG